VLEQRHIEPLADFLREIKPMPAVFDNRYVTRLHGDNVKRGKTKRDLAEQLRQDIRDFKTTHRLDRVVAVWCASTETYIKAGPQHATIEQFEKAMERNDDAIAPSMLYAWACIMEGVPYCNGAPNLAVDTPALMQLAIDRGVPISGKDFKTGQTWMKTVIAPGLKARMLDLALFSDFAQRAGLKGIQEWLSFYYKSPMAAPALQPEHDLFIQQTKLKNTLRHLMGEEQITHLGLEYYQS